MSQASAMLTGVLAKRDWRLAILSGPESGRHEGARHSGRDHPPENGPRSADFVTARRFNCFCPRPDHWTEGLSQASLLAAGNQGPPRPAPTERAMTEQPKRSMLSADL